MRGRSASKRKRFWDKIWDVLLDMGKSFTADGVYLIYKDRHPRHELTLNEVRARLRILNRKGELRRINSSSPAVYEVVD